MAEKNTHTLSHLDCHHHHHLEGLWVVHKLRQFFWIKYFVHEIQLPIKKSQILNFHKKFYQLKQVYKSHLDSHHHHHLEGFRGAWGQS